jgi:hypothetical protein
MECLGWRGTDCRHRSGGRPRPDGECPGSGPELRVHQTDDEEDGGVDGLALKSKKTSWYSGDAFFDMRRNTSVFPVRTHKVACGLHHRAGAGKQLDPFPRYHKVAASD